MIKKYNNDYFVKSLMDHFVKNHFVKMQIWSKSIPRTAFAVNKQNKLYLKQATSHSLLMALT